MAVDINAVETAVALDALVASCVVVVVVVVVKVASAVVELSPVGVDVDVDMDGRLIGMPLIIMPPMPPGAWVAVRSMPSTKVDSKPAV